MRKNPERLFEHFDCNDDDDDDNDVTNDNRN